MLSPTVKRHVFRRTVIGPLYKVGPFVLAEAIIPSLLEQTVDYAGFLLMNGLVDALDTWRRVRDSREFFGAIIGATVTTILFALTNQ